MRRYTTRDPMNLNPRNIDPKKKEENIYTDKQKAFVGRYINYIKNFALDIVQKNYYSNNLKKE
jgi:hypothetical protein